MGSGEARARRSQRYGERLVQNEPWRVARVGEPSYKTPGWTAMNQLVASLGRWYWKYIGKRPTVTRNHHHPDRAGKFVSFVHACCDEWRIQKPTSMAVESALK